MFLLNSAYLGDYELTYSKSFFSKNGTKKFHVYYQAFGAKKLYLLRIKDEKFQRLLCLDEIKDLEDFNSGNLDKLEFKSLDIQTGTETRTIYKFSKNNKNNSENFREISYKLSQPPVTASE